MALGIKGDGVHTELSIPLDWNNNEDLALQFEMLAHELRTNKSIEIHTARLSTPINNNGLTDKSLLEFICSSDHFDKPQKHQKENCPCDDCKVQDICTTENEKLACQKYRDWL